jgi:26S proteasome regulatory subunit N1
MSDRKEATIKVPESGGGKKPEDKEPQQPLGPQTPNPELKDLDKEKAKDDAISAEDAALKERLELAVERATKETDAGLQTAALELLRTEIRGATSSMTSVPKPFKFLAPHFKTLRVAFEGPSAAKSPSSSSSAASAAPALSPNSVPAGAKFVDPAVRMLAADILSVLSMTMGEEGKRETLKFKFLGNREDIGAWGSEYVRHLAGEIGQEYQHRQEQGKEGQNEFADLLGLIRVILPYNMAHNAEVEAVDLLLETEQLDMLLEPGAVDEASHGRVCLYLLRCSDYSADVTDAEHTQRIAFNLYLNHKQYTQALVTALRMGGPQAKERVDKVFSSCEDRVIRKQMGHLLGRHKAMAYIAKDDGAFI